MKSFEYDDDNEMDEDFILDVAEETLPIIQNNDNNPRRTSQRFKDRVKSLRVQSQETCAREGNPGLCKSDGGDDIYELTDRGMQPLVPVLTCADTALSFQPGQLKFAPGTTDAGVHLPINLVAQNYEGSAGMKKNWT